MADQNALDDRQHAIEFQKMLESWRPLRAASRTSIHTLARYEPADAQTHQARAILDALRAHGKPTARFVASQCGNSESKAVLWWVKAQLADNFALDDESATRFDDISLIVDNALLQVEAATASERHFMELAIAEARKSKAEDPGPHPMVGAVVVRDGKVIATAHRGELALGDHAEFTALEKKLKDETLAGATVYATLEPCTRRSPEKTPCAQRLIDRRVKKVVIGVLDPNPVICGKGQRLLQKNGIEVKHFDHDLAMQLEELNREWTKMQEAAANAQPPTPTPTPTPPAPAPPPEGPTRAQSATRSKVGFLVILVLLLLAAAISVALILPQFSGHTGGPGQSGPEAPVKDKTGPEYPIVNNETPEAINPVQPVTITCFLADGAESKRSLFPLKCVGGHADGCIQLVATQPADMMRAGSTLVWVVSCAEYRHLPPETIDKMTKSRPKTDGPGYSFVYVPTDKHRVEVAAVSVYELRAASGAPALFHLGEVELSTYQELVEKGEVAVNKKPEKVLYLRTSPGNHRRVEVAPVKCADGPAAKKYVPVLLEPEKAVANNVILWPCLDLEPRPPDDSRLLSSRMRDWNAPSHVAHLSWYRLTKSGGGTFEARYDFHPDAEDYVTKHRPALAQKLPLLLKELESLKKQMSEDVALVRKDYAAKKIHAGAAKVGEERYTSVLARHNATIEHLIEMLTGASTYRGIYDTQRVLEEEERAVDDFLAWHDQRDLPPDIPIKNVYRSRMKKLAQVLQESNRDFQSEYAALDDEAKRSVRAQLRATAYEPWPIKGE